jgi:branched-chain amino acid transport system permease protein
MWEAQQMLWQQIISGVAVGCIYALVALGFVLIYKATEVINFAQGEFMMIGAFAAYTLIVLFKLLFLPAFVFTLIFMFLFGILLDRLIFRPLVGEGAFALVMVTIGLAFTLRSLAGMIWTYDTFDFPFVFSEKPLDLGGLVISKVHLTIIVSSVILMFLLYLFFKFTDIGIAMQATSQNQLAAYLMGIGVKKVFLLTWAISAVIAAIAGILIAPISFLHANMGFIGLKAFPAAVLGGFGSIPGAIVGGLIIGLSENLAGGYLTPGFKNIFAYIILILVLMIRPEGIFGVKEKKRV